MMLILALLLTLLGDPSSVNGVVKEINASDLTWECENGLSVNGTIIYTEVQRNSEKQLFLMYP